MSNPIAIQHLDLGNPTKARVRIATNMRHGHGFQWLGSNDELANIIDLRATAAIPDGGNASTSFRVCSNCGTVLSYPYPNYCSDCGARIVSSDKI